MNETSAATEAVKQAIKEEARRLGFSLVGVAAPEPPQHYQVYEHWLAQGRHGNMAYLSEERARQRRANPKLILPECKSILVLATPYYPSFPKGTSAKGKGKIASYAWGDDYHIVLPQRMQALVAFIEQLLGEPVPNRWYTDTGPILERDLAQQAGLGWIGKNACLINPKHGSYFLLSEILLGIMLEPDSSFQTDQCGTCTRCIQACPTECILPDRTIDARRCISYLTIENKEEIPVELRPQVGDWVFGCDICQAVCPWNRFAAPEGEAAFAPRSATVQPDLIQELALSPQDFNRKFKDSPVKRAKRRGYLRNVAVALGNSGKQADIPIIENAANDPEPLVREHTNWAIQEINAKNNDP